jgi:hypothetical protein
MELPDGWLEKQIKESTKWHESLSTLLNINSQLRAPCPRCGKEFVVYFDEAFRAKERCGCTVNKEERVAMNVGDRWELGVPHDPRSVEIYESIRRIDMENGDYFDWTSGGDGDNGEHLMYLLDIHFSGGGK